MLAAICTRAISNFSAYLKWYYSIIGFKSISKTQVHFGSGIDFMHLENEL